MGTSKGILLSGIALVIGLYTSGVKQADGLTASTAVSRVNDVQSYAIARSGLRFALNDLATRSWGSGTWSSSVNMFGGSLTYTVDNQHYGTGNARIWTTGTFNGKQTKIITDVTKTWSGWVHHSWRRGSMWEINKMYVAPA